MPDNASTAGDASTPGDAGIPGDAGTARRVQRRTAAAAAVAGVITALVVVLGWVAPGWFVGVPGAVIGGSALALCTWGTLVLGRRAVLWTRAADLATRWDRPGAVASRADGPPGIAARCGSPTPLRRARRGPTMRRRPALRTHVLPLRTASGALSEGRAVIVHPRPDQLLPQPADRIEVHELGHRGPFLIRRAADDVVFVADCWMLSVL